MVMMIVCWISNKTHTNANSRASLIFCLFISFWLHLILSHWSIDGPLSTATHHIIVMLNEVSHKLLYIDKCVGWRAYVRLFEWARENMLTKWFECINVYQNGKWIHVGIFHLNRNFGFGGCMFTKKNQQTLLCLNFCLCLILTMDKRKMREMRSVSILNRHFGVFVNVKLWKCPKMHWISPQLKKSSHLMI